MNDDLETKWYRPSSTKTTLSDSPDDDGVSVAGVERYFTFLFLDVFFLLEEGTGSMAKHHKQEVQKTERDTLVNDGLNENGHRPSDARTALSDIPDAEWKERGRRYPDTDSSETARN